MNLLKNPSIVILVRVLLIIALLAVSAYFVKACVSKFIKKSTTFTRTSTKRIFIENPTMVLCFGPGYKSLNWTGFDFKNINVTPEEYWIRKSVYVIGQDFNVTVSDDLYNSNIIIYKEGNISILSNGPLHLFSLDVKHIITTTLGLCYKFISRSTLQGYFALRFKLSLNPLLDSKPQSLTIVFTSEQNSIGIAYNDWFEGKEFIIEANIGEQYQQKIHLHMKQTVFLPETSNCAIDSTVYNCAAQNFYQINDNIHCERPCVPYKWQHILNYGINKTLSICLTQQEVDCMVPLMLKNLFTSFVECSTSCERFEYYGSVHKEYATERMGYSYNEARWMLHFTSTRTVIETESLIFDTIDMIIYVGGTFGLTLGFSVYDNLMKLMNNLL